MTQSLLRCSFCGRSQKEVDKIVVGSPDGDVTSAAYICDRCVDEAIDHMEKERRRRVRFLSDERTVKLIQHLRTDPAILDRIDDLYGEQLARESLAWIQLVETRGELVRRTAREFAEVEQPPPVIQHVLAAEVNLLGGQHGQGKSLLARDWSLSVASGSGWRGHQVPEARNVLWIASEGLHDFQERWTTQPLWEEASDRVYMLDQPVSLIASADVAWLLEEFEDVRPGLVVFDVIYGMGMHDENGVKDVLPVLNSMKKLSAEWGAATLALGHPGHDGKRRFRGSSMWRNLAYTDWFMGDGLVTCEKSKVHRAESLAASYSLEYPSVRWLTTSEALADGAERDALIRRRIEENPEVSDRRLARTLMATLGLSESRTRSLVSAVRRTLEDVNEETLDNDPV